MFIVSTDSLPTDELLIDDILSVDTEESFDAAVPEEAETFTDDLFSTSTDDGIETHDELLIDDILKTDTEESSDEVIFEEDLGLEEASFFTPIKNTFSKGIKEIKNLFNFENSVIAQEDNVFQSVKIKISFAIDEIKPDIFLLEEKELAPAPEETDILNRAEKFFGKIKQTVIEQIGKIKCVAEQVAQKAFEAKRAIARQVEKFKGVFDSLDVNAEEYPDVLSSIIDTDTKTVDLIEIIEPVNVTSTDPILSDDPDVFANASSTDEESFSVVEEDDEYNEEPSVSDSYRNDDMLLGVDTKIRISYSLDGIVWWTLDEISEYPLSNKSNNGYFEYDASFLENWKDIENLQIKFEGVIGGERNIEVYLDSVWVEVSETEAELQVVEQISIKKDFQSNQIPEFRFKHKKMNKGLLASLGEALNITDYWNGINVQVEIRGPHGKISAISSDILFENNGEFSVKLPVDFFEKNGRRPGLYEIILKIEEDGEVKEFEQEFGWGVLAINVNKSIYLPNEQAYLQMAVLKDNGHTICDADLALKITYLETGAETNLSTADGTIQYSGQCKGNNVTNVPDYFAYYQTNESGTYQMELTNLNTSSEIIDRFEVRESVPFDIERIGPTRIYPPATYEVVLKIKASENFSGEIKETVPTGFKIVESDNARISMRDNMKKIIWQVAWGEGGIYELRYQFDAPDISPYLYLLGPLRVGGDQSTDSDSAEDLVSGDEEEKNIFEKAGDAIGDFFSYGEDASSDIIMFSEVRQWQIASDAEAVEDMLVYRGGGDTSIPEYRTHNALDGWATEATSSDVTGAIEWVKVAAHPSNSSDEKVLCTKDSNDTTNCQVWDGSSWGNLEEMAASGVAGDRSFDVCYEQVSGDAMVFYRTAGNTSIIGYKIWSGSSWGNEQTLQDVGGPLTTIRCVKESGTNYIAVMAHDTADDCHLVIWDGTTTTHYQETDDNCSVCDGCFSFDGAWESNTGDFVEAHYADGDHAIDGYLWTRSTGNFSVLNDIIGGVPTAEKTWIEMKANPDPTSDQILIVVADDDDDLEQNSWDGDAWGSESQLSGDIGGVTEASRGFALGFERNSYNALLTYGLEVTQPTYREWTTTSGWGSPQTLSASAPEAIDWHQLSSDSHSNNIMLTMIGVTDDVATIEWNGSAWDAAWESHETASDDVMQNAYFVYDNEDEIVLTQNYYRWRADLDSLSTTTNGWLAAENTELVTTASSTVRLRIEVANTGGTATNYQYQLEYAAKNGTCAASSFSVIPTSTASGPFEMFNSTHYVNNASTTVGHLTGVGSWYDGYGIEDDYNMTLAHSLPSDNYTEFEYAVRMTEHATTSYCLRLTNNNSTSTFVYSEYAEIGVPNVDELHYRWRNDDGGEANKLLSKLYGGTGDDTLSSVYVDGNYVYAVGSTASEGQGGTEALIIKFDELDLSISQRKIYGGTGADSFTSVYVDGDYVYAVGSTASEGTGGSDALIMKFNKSDLSISSRKVYGGTGDDYFTSVYVDGNYIYALGYTWSEGEGNNDGLIIKFNKSDLSISQRKIYGGADYEYLRSIYVDGDYVYIVGSSGTGYFEALIIKFNKSDLSISEKTLFGGDKSEIFYSVYVDGDYVYAVGETASEGPGNRSGLIIKFNKSDLSISSKKVYGGTDYDYFYGIYVDGDYVYATGYTKSEGAGDYDSFTIKFNKSDLSISKRKLYGGTVYDRFRAVYVDGDYVYAVGETSSKGEGGKDGLVIKFNKSMDSGTETTTPAGFTYQDSAKTLADSTKTLSNSNETLADSTKTLATSAETFATSTKTLSTSYSIGVAPASWKQDEDDFHTGQAKEENVRVRFTIDNDGATASDYNYRLQYAALGAATSCEVLATGNFADVATTSGGVVIMATSTYFADGDTTINLLSIPSGSSFTSGKMVEYSSNETDNITLSQNYFTEVEYNFQFTNSVPGNTTYCFRTVNSTTDLDSYAKVATITTGNVTYAQNDFRWYENIDANTPTTALAAENASTSDVANNAVIRARMNVTVGEFNLAADTQAFKLQYASTTDICTSTLSWNDVGQIASSTIWRGYNNASVSDGATLATTTLSLSDVLGTYEEENNSANNPNAVSTTDDIEYDWVIQNNGAGGTYCFRMVKSNGDALDGYNTDSFPQVGALNVDELHYRWRNDDGPARGNWLPFESGNDFEFVTDTAAWPSSIQIDDTHYLVTYEGPDNDGWSTVLEVNTSTWAVTTSSAAFEFDKSNGGEPSLSQVDDNHYLVVYSGGIERGWSTVLEVNTSTWAISTSSAAFRFEPTQSMEHSAISQIDDTHYLVAYLIDSNLFRSRVLEVTTSTIATSSNSYFIGWDPGAVSARPSLLKIDANHFLTAHHNSGDKCESTVLEVNTSTWAISEPNSEIEVSASVIQMDSGVALSQIDDNHYLAVYGHYSRTVEVNTSTWAISTPSAECAYTSDGIDPAISQINDTHYLVAYEESGDDGWSRVLEVNASTWAISTSSSAFEFDGANGQTSAISQIDDTHYLVTYEGPDNDGWSTILEVGTGASWKQNEDTTHTSQAKEENIRVRFTLDNDGATAADYNYRLQSAALGAATSCEVVASGNFSDVSTTTGVVIMTTSTYFTNQETTTNLLTTPSGSTFTAGKIVEYSSNETENITLSQNYFTEVEYNFQFTASVAASTTYCFRVVNSTTDLDSYTKVATITTAEDTAGITVSGNAYNDEASTVWTKCDGSTGNISLVVNGTFIATTTCAAGDGAYSFSSVTTTTSDPVSVFFNTNGSNTDEGVAITVAVDDSSNITLNPRLNRVWVKSETGVANITNTDLAHCDSNSPSACSSIPYTATTSALVLESAAKLIIESNKTFVPGGTVTLTVGATSAQAGGDVLISPGATFNAEANAVSVSGDWNNNGIFSNSNNTVTFTATSTGFSITASSSAFYNLTFNGSGGVWDLQDNATSTNDVTITAGTLDLNGQNLVVQGGDITVTGTLAADVDSGTVTLSGSGDLGGSGTTTAYNLTLSGITALAGNITVNNDLTISGANSLDASASNYDITVAGSWSNASGTFTAQEGTVTFTSSGAEAINPGSSSFFDLTFDGSGGWTFSAAATTSNDLTITQGTVTSTSGILAIGGSWSNSGTFTHNSGTILFNGSASETIADGTSAFHLLNFDGSGSWLYADGCSTAPATTTVDNGTPTFLNAKTGATVVNGGTLNMDWYLGVHVVDANDATHNIESATATIYSTSTADITIWKYNSGWGTASTTQETITAATGINPQPTSNGAIRIREYKKTSATTTYYKYNLTVASLGGFDAYDYYQDYGNNYLTSTSSDAGSNVDKTISISWYRATASSMNGSQPYSGLNEPPEEGSWHVGMPTDLEISVNSVNVDLGELYGVNYYTATGTTILYATTTYSGGYNITAWSSNDGRLRLGATATYIARWNHPNSTPALWSSTCDASAECGFGYTTSDSELGGTGDADRFATSTKYAGFATSTPGDMVADSAGSASGATTTIRYRVSVASIQTTGDYSTTIYYICTANY